MLFNKSFKNIIGSNCISQTVYHGNVCANKECNSFLVQHVVSRIITQFIVIFYCQNLSYGLLWIQSYVIKPLSYCALPTTSSIFVEYYVKYLTLKWRTHLIKQIPISGFNSVVENYTPICLLCIPCKILGEKT